MPPTLDADLVQIFVALPGPDAGYAALGGEERGRLSLERKPQERLALGQGAWEAQLSAGRASLTLEAEGRSQHGPAEAHLHACAFQGLPCQLRLRIGTATWLEGQFALVRLQLDTPSGDVARYSLTALSDGEITLTPLTD